MIKGKIVIEYRKTNYRNRGFSSLPNHSWGVRANQKCLSFHVLIRTIYIPKNQTISF